MTLLDIINRASLAHDGRYMVMLTWLGDSNYTDVYQIRYQSDSDWWTVRFTRPDEFGNLFFAFAKDVKMKFAPDAIIIYKLENVYEEGP